MGSDCSRRRSCARRAPACGYGWPSRRLVRAENSVRLNECLRRPVGCTNTIPLQIASYERATEFVHPTRSKSTPRHRVSPPRLVPTFAHLPTRETNLPNAFQAVFGRSLHEHVTTNPSVAKEGVSFASVRTTPMPCLQELSQSVAAIERLDHVPDHVARRRACPRVPASPKCTRLVPARNPYLAIAGNTTCPVAGLFFKPSDGLEPSTPSLPCDPIGNRSQHTATVFACFSPFRRSVICHRVPLVAPARLHRRSNLCRREVADRGRFRSASRRPFHGLRVL
jgi:hypothetical protein